ncbi:hypothetical protein E3N88_17322 [Mikania micrantha]|uniref:Uncharacterized protein n=1 Tax=Mikania micrantha TaxID=192012 RepID=A0A5N6NRJ5_9ASTR|nr:hypothetical protein E3N88_17322 [Mikania micrantha]
MDRYTKVEQKKPDTPINQNEIRITSQGLVRNYISYANTLLQERHGKEIILNATGQAISKTRNIPRLHQDTNISSISITDVWEPIEEGLLPVEMTRQVSMISITLSTKELNKNSPGYQAPLNVERPKPRYNYHRQQPQQYNAINEDKNSYSNRNRGGSRWENAGYHGQTGGGYMRGGDGRGGGGVGRFNGRGRDRMGGQRSAATVD